MAKATGFELALSQMRSEFEEKKRQNIELSEQLRANEREMNALSTAMSALERVIQIRNGELIEETTPAADARVEQHNGYPYSNIQAALASISATIGNNFVNTNLARSAATNTALAAQATSAWRDVDVRELSAEDTDRDFLSTAEKVERIALEAGGPITRKQIQEQFEQRGWIGNWKYPNNTINSAVGRTIDAGDLVRLGRNQVVHQEFAPEAIPAVEPLIDDESTSDVVIGGEPDEARKI